jgi:hypothetical protein
MIRTKIKDPLVAVVKKSCDVKKIVQMQMYLPIQTTVNALRVYIPLSRKANAYTNVRILKPIGPLNIMESDCDWRPVAILSNGRCLEYRRRDIINVPLYHNTYVIMQSRLEEGHLPPLFPFNISITEIYTFAENPIGVAAPSVASAVEPIEYLTQVPGRKFYSADMGGASMEFGRGTRWFISGPCNMGVWHGYRLNVVSGNGLIVDATTRVNGTYLVPVEARSIHLDPDGPVTIEIN